MAKSVLIIGGGLGGLVCGSLLSKEGYRVTILEKHMRMGGGLHNFNRKGHVFDTGIHYFGGFQQGATLNKIFSWLGIADQLELMPMDTDAFDVVHIGDELYQLAVGKDRFISNLAEHFPHQRQALMALFDDLYAICDTFPPYNLQAQGEAFAYLTPEALVSVGEFIASRIDDSKLRRVLAWNNCLYAGSEDRTPVYVYALLMKFFVEGPVRFVNGSQQLADKMCELIAGAGGELICRCEADRIIVKDKKVQAVISKDGREFVADYYISDIHPAILMDMMGPEQLPKAYRERMKTLNNSYSAFMSFITVKPGTFPYMNSNHYFFREYDSVWKQATLADEDFPESILLCTPPGVNQGVYADTIVVICSDEFARYKKWENTQVGKRGDDYLALKLKMEKQILSCMEKFLPGVTDCIETIESGTPLTLRDYLGSKDGSLYGYVKDCTQIHLSQLFPRTKFSNLLITGQNLHLHGILGVPISAVLTVEALLGENYLIQKINNYCI